MKNTFFISLIVSNLSIFGLSNNIGFSSNNNLLYLCSGHESSINEQTPQIINDFLLPDFPILPPDNPFPPIVPVIENHYYTNRDFTINYFSNLKTNILKNVAGNCGITAISMLLGYYDTYWNDDIILSQYDKVGVLINDNLNGAGSPGVDDLTTFNFSSNNLTDTQKSMELNQFVDNKIAQKETDFFGLLLYYGDLEGVYKNVGTHLGIEYDNIVDILNLYISNNAILSQNAVLQHNKVENFANRNEMRNYIIGLIEQGQPVIIGGNGIKNTTGEKYGHVCIAYDYDSVNDVLIGNGGWGQGSFSLNGETQYNLSLNLDSYFNTRLSDFYYIEVGDNISHNHPKNYYNNDINNYICSCELNTHSHDYNYVTHDTIDHYRKCICMLLSEKNNHFFTHTILKDGNEYSVCGGCGYSKLSSTVPQPGV